MNIHANFTGGNIRVLDVRDADVYVQNEIRDTTQDWFYWAFCVEGAQGLTLTFHFDKKWIGYCGPAVSHDLAEWRWLNASVASAASDTFSYTFGEYESTVYFAHDMLYHPAHFDLFCEKHGFEQHTLCVSERGREVPYIRFGEGRERVMLTARHHACEATGSYVLEGVLEELAWEPIQGLEVIAVPFVDYDGVVDGDQGKSRAPHDQNRDYPPEGESIYAAVREIRKIALEKHVRYAFDYHSPWHLGGMNDWVFIVEKHYPAIKHIARFANLWQSVNTPEALPYDATDTLPPETDWNTGPAETCTNFMYVSAGAELAFTVETPYFTCYGTPFSAERAREMGRCFVRGLRLYHNRPVKLSFTGDLLYNAPMNQWCKTSDGYDYLPLLKQVWTRVPDADYLVGNIETTVCGADMEYTNSRWAFNTPEEALQALKETGFDLLSLANNHCMDRKAEAIPETLDACDRAGLEHIGLYRTQAENEAVFVREIGGIRVGFVNVTYGTNAFAHHNFLNENQGHMVKLSQPEETLPGSIHLLLSPEEIEEQTRKLYSGEADPLVAKYLERLKDDIARTKAQSDFVVMLLHSGGQHNPEPDAYTRMLTEKIWSYGADIIVSNHPHIIQSSTLEDGRFTCYCLGNLICAEPAFSKAGHIIDSDFSSVLNLTLKRRPDGSLEKSLSFRLCQIMHDPTRKTAPWVVDTYDYWRKHPYDAYRETILFYANRFMPGKGYAEPMAEYPIC